MDARRFLAVPTLACALAAAACGSSQPTTSSSSTPDVTTTPTVTSPAPTATTTVIPSAPVVTPTPSVTTTIAPVPVPAPPSIPTPQPEAPTSDQAPPAESPAPQPQVVTVTQVGIDSVRILQCNASGVQLEVKFAVWYTGQGEVRVMFGGDPSHPDDSYGRALYSVTNQANPYRAVLTIAPPSAPVHTLVVSAYGANDLLQAAVRDNIACDG